MNLLNKKHLWLFLCLLLWLNGCAFSQSKETVCITKTGAKYHRCTCHYLKYSSIELGKEDASERGYTPCSVCKPGFVDNVGEPASPGAPQRSAQPQRTVKQTNDNPSVSKQCTATTKAGTRCKRTASAGSNTCWQHQ